MLIVPAAPSATSTPPRLSMKTRGLLLTRPSMPPPPPMLWASRASEAAPALRSSPLLLTTTLPAPTWRLRLAPRLMVSCRPSGPSVVEEKPPPPPMLWATSREEFSPREVMAAVLVTETEPPVALLSPVPPMTMRTPVTRPTMPPPPPTLCTKAVGESLPRLTSSVLLVTLTLPPEANWRSRPPSWIPPLEAPTRPPPPPIDCTVSTGDVFPSVRAKSPRRVTLTGPPALLPWPSTPFAPKRLKLSSSLPPTLPPPPPMLWMKRAGE